MYVHLNDVSFTTPRASYTTGSAISPVFFGEINQRTAPGGWSLVGSANMGGVSRMFIMNAYDRSGGYYAGADAIKVAYTYL